MSTDVFHIFCSFFGSNCVFRFESDKSATVVLVLQPAVLYFDGMWNFLRGISTGAEDDKKPRKMSPETSLKAAVMTESVSRLPSVPCCRSYFHIVYCVAPFNDVSCCRLLSRRNFGAWCLWRVRSKLLVLLASTAVLPALATEELPRQYCYYCTVCSVATGRVCWCLIFSTAGAPHFPAVPWSEYLTARSSEYTRAVMRAERLLL
jgi:hypothetical protein